MTKELTVFKSAVSEAVFRLNVAGHKPAIKIQISLPERTVKTQRDLLELLL